MMKILITLASVFFGAKAAKPFNFNFKDMAMEVVDEIALKTRKPVILLLGGIVSIIFFCSGVLIAIMDATRQYDTSGQILGTATLWTGIGIAAVFAIGYSWVFLVEWPGAKRQAKRDLHKLDQKMHTHSKGHNQQHEHEIPGIEQAISLFVLDLLEERKAKRTRRESASQAARGRADAMTNPHPGYQEGSKEDPRGYA
jgi:hypothetical protein